MENDETMVWTNRLLALHDQYATAQRVINFLVLACAALLVGLAYALLFPRCR